MVFTYYVQCSPSYYSEQTDEEFYDEESFEYEVDSDKAEDTAAEIIASEIVSFKKVMDKTPEEIALMRKTAIATAKKIISDFDIDLEEVMGDELKDYFESEAMQAYREE